MDKAVRKDAQNLVEEILQEDIIPIQRRVDDIRGNRMAF